MIDDFRKSWKDKMIFFGPGLLIAITAAGEFGIVEATEAGAHFGLELFWVVLVALLFKYVFTIGIARYTLATGKTIFEGLADMPGPYRWGQVLVIAAYFVDILSLGSMVLFAAVYLDYLLPGTYSTTMLALIVMLAITVFIRLRKLHKYSELALAILVLILAVSMIIIFGDFPIGLDNYISGLQFHIPEGSEPMVLAIIGVCGNGLNIMLYSHWLNNKIKDSGINITKKKSFYTRYIRSVRWDLGIGFIIVLFVTLGFMAMGYIGFTISLMPEGEELVIDTLVSQTMYIMQVIQFGIYLFPVILMLIFMGAVTVGLEARISVIGKIIHDHRTESGKETNMRLLYFLLYCIFFAGIMGVVLMDEPLITIQLCSSMCALLFGIFGFMLLYLDSTLPEYARGSRIWKLMLGFGSIVTLYVALLIEKSFIMYGLPLLESITLATVLVFLFTKTQTFKDMMAVRADFITRLWVMAFFGFISIYGTFGGVNVAFGDVSLMINYRDFGAMVAGVVGGPWMGLGAALIGGAYRLTVGGMTAIPCFIATLAAGFGSGLLMRRWLGQYTIRRAVSLAIIFESLHLMVIFPVYMLLFTTMDPMAILSTIIALFLPMIIVNSAGMVAFWYFTRRIKVFESVFNVINFREYKAAVKASLKPKVLEDDDDDGD